MFLILLDVISIVISNICEMYYTYITTNHGKNVLYTGMTNNLKIRIQQHKDGRGNNKTFTGKYYCYKLVYFEEFETPIEAIRREKEIKNMSREMKFALIRSKNPSMNFLWPW